MSISALTWRELIFISPGLATTETGKRKQIAMMIGNMKYILVPSLAAFTFGCMPSAQQANHSIQANHVAPEVVTVEVDTTRCPDNRINIAGGTFRVSANVCRGVSGWIDPPETMAFYRQSSIAEAARATDAECGFTHFNLDTSRYRTDDEVFDFGLREANSYMVMTSNAEDYGDLRAASIFREASNSYARTCYWIMNYARAKHLQ